MFVIISVFNVGVILTTALKLGETNVLQRSLAIYQVMIPVVALVIVWWFAQFYEVLWLKLIGWLVLFTLVFYSMIFIMIMAGVDIYLGFNVVYLVYGYFVAPIPALFVLIWIIRRYCSCLNRRLTQREKMCTVVSIVFFLLYWLIVPFNVIG